MKRPSASQHIKRLYLQQNLTNKSLRLSVLSKGCAGNSYDFQFVDKPIPTDECIQLDNGCKLFIDGRAVLKIIGSELDYKEDVLSSGFVVHNPNVQSACGCGESFSVANSD